MIKRYLGITLITASMLVAGCSSSDDDDDPMGGTTNGDTTDGDTTDGDTTDGDTTDGDTTDGDTTDGDTTDGDTTDGDTTGGGPTDGADFVIGGTVNNSTATTGRADAVIRVVHASDNAATIIVTVDADNDAPLIGDPLDSGTGLTNTVGAAGPFAVDAGAHTVELYRAGDFFASNFTPTLSVGSLTAAAGSSTTFVARGDAVGTDAPLQLISLVNQSTTDNAGGGLVRIVHAARGMAIVFDGLTSGELDLFLTTDGSTNGTAAVSGFSYDDVSTDYIEMPAANYQLVATEAGNSARERITLAVPVTVGSVQTIIIRDTTNFGMAADLVVIDDTVSP